MHDCDDSREREAGSSVGGNQAVAGFDSNIWKGASNWIGAIGSIPPETIRSLPSPSSFCPRHFNVPRACPRTFVRSDESNGFDTALSSLNVLHEITTHRFRHVA